MSLRRPSQVDALACQCQLFSTILCTCLGRIWPHVAPAPSFDGTAHVGPPSHHAESAATIIQPLVRLVFGKGEHGASFECNAAQKTVERDFPHKTATGGLSGGSLSMLYIYIYILDCTRAFHARFYRSPIYMKQR